MASSPIAQAAQNRVASLRGVTGGVNAGRGELISKGRRESGSYGFRSQQRIKSPEAIAPGRIPPPRLT